MSSVTSDIPDAKLRKLAEYVAREFDGWWYYPDDLRHNYNLKESAYWLSGNKEEILSLAVHILQFVSEIGVGEESHMYISDSEDTNVLSIEVLPTKAASI